MKTSLASRMPNSAALSSNDNSRARTLFWAEQTNHDGRLAKRPMIITMPLSMHWPRHGGPGLSALSGYNTTVSARNSAEHQEKFYSEARKSASLITLFLIDLIIPKSSAVVTAHEPSACALVLSHNVAGKGEAPAVSFTCILLSPTARNPDGRPEYIMCCWLTMTMLIVECNSDSQV